MVTPTACRLPTGHVDPPTLLGRSASEPRPITAPVRETQQNSWATRPTVSRYGTHGLRLRAGAGVGPASPSAGPQRP